MPLKVFGIAYKERGFKNYLELYRSAYTTESLWYRLQRRGFINYLELYRSAYITKGFGIVVNEEGL